MTMLDANDHPPMKRDPHLPPPEVCDWLLGQEWSPEISTTYISYPEGGPGGMVASSLYGFRHALCAIGADEIARLFMPVEALEALQADQDARENALDEKRRACQVDDELRRHGSWPAPLTITSKRKLSTLDIDKLIEEVEAQK